MGLWVVWKEKKSSEEKKLFRWEKFGVCGGTAQQRSRAQLTRSNQSNPTRWITRVERVERRGNKRKKRKGRRKGVFLSTERRFLAPPPMTSERCALRCALSFKTGFYLSSCLARLLRTAMAVITSPRNIKENHANNPCGSRSIHESTHPARFPRLPPKFTGAIRYDIWSRRVTTTLNGKVLDTR